MKVAFSVWNNRIAPVFDTSVEMVIVETEDKDIKSEKFLSMRSPDISEKFFCLQQENAEVLICGAVSKVVQEQLVSAGIEVIPFISGELRAVIEGWLTQSLSTDNFAMPGCCGRRRGCCNTPPGQGRGRRLKNGSGRVSGRGIGRR